MPHLIDTTAHINQAAWEHHARVRLAEPSSPPARPRRFQWSQQRDVGPGIELLGALAGARVAELGCGPGDNLAHMASHGVVEAVGVDLAYSQIARARARWGHLPNTSFHVADARTYLAGPCGTFDICYSVFGAIEFCPPEQLIPLATNRLPQGGRLVFSVSHPARPAAPNLFLADGTRAPIMRFQRSVAAWTSLVNEAGLTLMAAREVWTAETLTPCCLIIVARKTRHRRAVSKARE
jgi:SAM-dependent methyltransferase